MLALLLLAGCVRFHSRPISAIQIQADFENRSLTAPELGNFLCSRSGLKTWPPPSWDLRSLILAALYYHPDLDVARAQWAVAQAGRKSAGERPNPAGSFLMGYNSSSPVAEVTPWIPEAALEIPIETAGKRGYRIAQARHLSEAARLNILAVAWEVRRRLRQAFLDLYASRQTATLLAEQQSIQADMVIILEAQLAAGEASAADVTQARIALDSGRLAALEAVKANVQALAQLAAAIGLPVAALDGIDFSFADLLQSRLDLPASEVRRRALVGRADILAALSEYQACQSALQLEIAKQFPDISIGSGFQLDQTDNKWTLGLNLLLALLNRNRGPIAEAEARRSESAARFLALQARVIGAVESAVLACRATAERAATADKLLENLTKQAAAARAQYEIGEISKLEWLGVRLETATAALSRLDALVKNQQVIGDLEDAMQGPLDLKKWVSAAPDRERKNE